MEQRQPPSALARGGSSWGEVVASSAHRAGCERPVKAPSALHLSVQFANSIGFPADASLVSALTPEKKVTGCSQPSPTPPSPTNPLPALLGIQSPPRATRPSSPQFSWGREFFFTPPIPFLSIFPPISGASHLKTRPAVQNTFHILSHTRRQFGPDLFDSGV